METKIKEFQELYKSRETNHSFKNFLNSIVFVSNETILVKL